MVEDPPFLRKSLNVIAGSSSSQVYITDRLKKNPKNKPVKIITKKKSLQ